MVFAILLRALSFDQGLLPLDHLRPLFLLCILLLDVELLDVVDQVILYFILLFLLHFLERSLRGQRYF